MQGVRQSEAPRKKRTKLCFQTDVQIRAENVIARMRQFSRVLAGEPLAILSRVAVELLVGRVLAIMRHPLLAWPRLPPSGRVVLAAGYAGVSYLTVIALLLTVQR